MRIEGTVKPDLLEWAIRQVVREAEPVRAAFFEVDGQVFQRAIDYPDVELACYDLSCSRHPVQEAHGLAVIDPTHADAVHWPAVQICVVSDAGWMNSTCSRAAIT